MKVLITLLENVNTSRISAGSLSLMTDAEALVKDGHS
jgi:hypothetical protein